jgi:hypothetical protein
MIEITIFSYKYWNCFFSTRDVLRFGLSRRQILPESDTIDAVVAVDVAGHFFHFQSMI